ncbi:MAG TPA: alpha/beta hydrolase [Chloroflexia bacterium]|jgi:pimeloyl-ACP methyl ester carboxylesterase|nr:alpha/beta hydrolase [Chloroflexia bacterium]
MSQPDLTEIQQGRYVQANGLNIYYEEYGKGEPLILLHGGTATLQSWREHIPAFAEHFRVIALDSRGHGRTDNPAGELSYSQMAGDVAAFIQALDLTRPLVFGYSDGGQVALELGIRYPDLANVLVLGGTCYKFPKQYFDALKGFGVERSGIRTVERLQTEAPDWVQVLKAEHGHGDDPNYWKTLMKQISELWWNVQDYEVEDLQKITAPTLILQGDRDEGVDVEQAVEMYRGIPNAELAVLPNARHGDLGEVSNRLVLDFLQRHASSTEPTQANA